MAEITVIDIKAAMELMREGMLTTPSKVLADVMAEVAKLECVVIAQASGWVSEGAIVPDDPCGKCIVCVAREVVNETN